MFKEEQVFEPGAPMKRCFPARNTFAVLAAYLCTVHSR